MSETDVEARRKKEIQLSRASVNVEQLIKFRDALARLVESPELFKQAAEAFEKDDAKRFREILEEIGILRFCWLVCRWFCVKTRGALCVILCPRPTKTKELTVEEMLQFGRASVQLMANEDVFKTLFQAYRQRDAERFQSILKEYKMIPFCVQFCRWFSHYYCRLKCSVFCPPTAKIISPSALACVQPKHNKVDDEVVFGVEVSGIASGGAPFLNYKLEYSFDGVTWQQDAPGSGEIVIVYPDGHRGGVSTTPVGPPPEILGYLDTSNLNGQTYWLRLTVTGGGMTATDTAQFQLHLKVVAIDEVGKVDVTPINADRKLIFDNIERAVGGYITIGGSAYVKGCGKRYQKYKLMWTDGWIPPPAPGTSYGAVGPQWKLIVEVDYAGKKEYEFCKVFYDNRPIGDLTRVWKKKKCKTLFLPPFDFWHLAWKPWYTNVVASPLKGLGKKITLLLAVQDNASDTYFDSLQIWVDNIPIEAKLDSIGIPGAMVSKCKPLSISKIMKNGGILEIKGTAWDDEIEPGNLTQPSLNFDRFEVGWKKNCDFFYHEEGIELKLPPGAPPLAVPGEERIKNDILATWDIRDPSDPTNVRPGIEPCAYIIQLRVWDNSRINDDGSHYVHKELAFTLTK